MGSEGVCVNVKLKDEAGSVLMNISKSVQSGDGQELPSLTQALRDLQNETNTALTQLMATAAVSTKNGKSVSAKQDDEDDSDDADEASSLKRSNSNSLVPSKRPCISLE